MKFYNIKFANENFEISPFGAIFWPNEEILIVSDLHLEKGSSYYQRGTFLPHTTLLILSTGWKKS